MKSKMNAFFVGLCILLGGLAKAQVAPVDKQNIANGGYDVVAYFEDSKAERGKSEYAYIYNGAKYYFVTEEHLQHFRFVPEMYLPQCDGYCAYAVAAKKTKVPINPETFKIVDGKLYLFFNGKVNGKLLSALPEWNKDEENLLKQLPANWEKLKGAN